MYRLRFAILMSFVACGFAASGTVSGQTASSGSGQPYPSKVIRIVASEAGSAGDNVARAVAQGLSASVGHQAVVDNRPGGVIAGDLVAKSPPDGYTLLSYGSNFWLLPVLRDQIPYDPVKDFAPVAITVTTLSVLTVHPSLPAKSVKELIALARSRPGVLNYASAIAGSSGHLTAEMFKRETRTNIVRIPFKGVATAVTAVMSGDVHMIFVSLGTAAPHIKSGKLKALALASPRPSELAPGLPTVASAGFPGFEGGSTFAMFVPAGTPANIVSFLNQEVVKILGRPEVKERFTSRGTEVVASTPAQLAERVKLDIARIGKLVKEAGIRDE